jgi:4-carboxymuconolactone decarboxylase
MSAAEDRRARGIAVYSSQFGIPPEEVVAFMTERFGARMAEEALSSSGGTAWEDDCLSLRDRSLIVLAALAAQGGVEARMRPHVKWAIEHGSSREELEAMMALLANYVGYPRASVALEVVREELDKLEREDR